MDEVNVRSRPFRYADNPEATEATGKKSNFVSIRLDHGVLVASLLVNGLTHEMVILDIKRQIENHLPRAKMGLVVDCSQVTLSASSAFLGKLIELRKTLAARDLPLAVCGLQGSLREAFDIACFSRVIPDFPTQKEAVAELGDFNDWDRVRMQCVAQYSARPKPAGKIQWDFSKLLSTRAMKISLAILLVIVGAAATVVVLSRAGGDQAAMAVVWQNAPKSSVQGEISYLSHGVKLLDAGSIVIAWPADFSPPNKHALSAQELFAQPTQARQITDQGPFIVASNGDGTFTVDVPVPQVDCNYYVLMLSAHSKSGRAVGAGDSAVLSVYFSEPDQLVDGHDFQLARCLLSAGQSTKLNWTAGRK